MRNVNDPRSELAMIKPDFSIENIIKLSIWLIFGGLAFTALFDFDDWANRVSWGVKFLLLALVLHMVVSWIYRD